MKGVVFTEFIEHVEASYSPDVVDELVDAGSLDSGGAYTTLGTYDHRELISLLDRLGERTGRSRNEHLTEFGTYLFGRFAALYPVMFEGIDNALTFLTRVEDFIHVEVRKLYHDAELPTFTFEQADPDHLEVVYESRRPFAAFAEGLVRGCIAHFGEAVGLEVEDLSGGEGTRARLRLTRSPR